MKERDWTIILNNIRAGNCILVLGPDCAVSKINEKYVPLTELLSNEFAKELENEYKILNKNDLAYTADLYAKKESENDMKYETISFYNNAKVETNGVYSSLTSIPFKLIINATPDKLLIKAYDKAKKKYISDFYDYKGKKRDMVEWYSNEKPLIYYLFGTIDEPSSLVISEKNLFEFLVSIISNDPPIQNNISSELLDDDKCFLFLGFGFRNWYLRILLYVLLCGGKANRSEKTSRSFAFETVMPANSSNFQQVCFVFRDDLKVEFPDLPVKDFVTELKSRYDEFAKEAETNEHSVTISENAASVFICHASENKDVAMQLVNKLREGGLDPWIDKEGLRGGDDWDRVLEKTIRESNYFIIVNSKELAAKTRGYVNKEISIALEEQKKTRSPFKFIFPVCIDDCKPYDILDNVHFTDLRDPAKYDELIKEIKRDFQRRKSN